MSHSTITHPWFWLSRHDEDPNPGGEDQGGTPPDKTFTQSELDRIVADRLTRERAKYSDHAELKNKAAELDKIRAEQQSEAEKLAADRDAALQRAELATTRAVSAEVRALADGFADRSDAALYLGDLNKYVTGGEIDTAAITAALAEVLVSKPHLAKPTGPRNPAPDRSQGHGGTGTAVDFRKASAEQVSDELAKYGLRPYGR